MGTQRYQNGYLFLVRWRMNCVWCRHTHSIGPIVKSRKSIFVRVCVSMSRKYILTRVRECLHMIALVKSRLAMHLVHGMGLASTVCHPEGDRVPGCICVDRILPLFRHCP